MSTPAEDTFRQELNDQAAVLIPEIDGLKEWLELKNDLDQLTIQYINDTLAARQRRLELIGATLLAMNNLDADGWPGLPNVQVPQSVLDDMDEEANQLKAGRLVFEAQPTQPVATQASVQAAVFDKPQP